MRVKSYILKLKRMINLSKQELKNRKSIRRTTNFQKTLDSCGSNLCLIGDPIVFSPERLSIGNKCKINQNVYINARSGVTIGDDVTLSYGAKIISTGYDIEHWVATGEKKHITDAPVVIGNHCWICTDAIILPGVKISGEYVVVAAGAIVTKDITESRVIVAGSPAKIIKSI